MNINAFVTRLPDVAEGKFPAPGSFALVVWGSSTAVELESLARKGGVPRTPPSYLSSLI